VRFHAKAALVGSIEAAVARGIAVEPRGGVRSSSISRLMVLVAITTALLFVGVQAALAAPSPGYGAIGSFGSQGSEPGQLAEGVGHLAVDDQTGEILVADTDNGRVEVFAPDANPGGTANYVTGFATGTSPHGIAIDQSTGAVYVGDTASNLIIRFLSDGAAVPTYSEDSSFASPVQGSEPGEVGDFSSALAVDPSTHDLIVADRGNQRVDRYSASGTFIQSFDGADTTGGAFTGLLDVAVSPTATYVLDSTGEPFWGASSRIERFDAAGASTGSLISTDNPDAIAIDSAHDRLVAIEGAGFESRAYVSVYPGGEAVRVADLPAAAANSTIGGLAIDGGSTRRLYAATSQAFGIFGATGVRAFASAPGVEAPVVTDLTSTGAHLASTVNPDGSQASAYFEYSRDGTNWTPTPGVDVGSGSGGVAISADPVELQPNSTYSFRAVAVSGQARATSAIVTGNTLVAPPKTISGAVTDRTGTSATLTGTITPYGLAASYYFEYGLTAAYGQRVPTQVNHVAGKGYAPLSVTEAITGLDAGTTYHYRLVGESLAGSASGADATFTTAVPGMPSRAYEMVSPVEKGGANVRSGRGSLGFQPSPDGNAIVYTTQSAFPEAESSPLLPRLKATRSEYGWSSQPVDPPLAPIRELSHSIVGTLAVSEDLSHALVFSLAKLAEGAVEGQGNLYVRDLQAGGYVTVATSPDPEFTSDFGNINHLSRFAGGTPDFSSLAFEANQPLLPEAASSEIYRWTAGKGLDIVSLVNGGPHGGGIGTSSPIRATKHQMSSDGRRIYFNVRYAFDGTEGIYLREGETSTLVSRSHIAGEDPTVGLDTEFNGASEDGRYAIFTVIDSRPLTPDAPASEKNIYRYDAVEDTLTYLAPAVDEFLQVSDDAQYVYFLSNVSQTVDATGSGPYLYVAHEGTVRLMAGVPPGDGAVSARPSAWMVSPNGRYFVFQSVAAPTGFDNHGGEECATQRALDSEGVDSTLCGEIFRYDTVTQSLTCVSCRVDGGDAVGEAGVGTGTESDLSHRYSQSVTDTGQVFFDTPDPLVAADINGSRDVYEYSGGEQNLISGGKAPANSFFEDATDDGGNVYFATDDRLVAQDQDDLNDLYTARLGGGIASQNVVPPRDGKCSAEDCRGALGSPPVPAARASESLAGFGDRSPNRARKPCGKGRHAGRSRGKIGCIKKHKQRKQHHSNPRRFR
jgi:DNA-binding beta-propeller fold protein YncE